MRSPSLSILPAVFAASVLTLGSLAHARAPDGETPDPDSSVAADVPRRRSSMTFSRGFVSSKLSETPSPPPPR
jgi:hypothetical protein